MARQGHGAARIAQAAWTGGGAVLRIAARNGKGLFMCACVCVCVLMWSGEALTRRENRGLARKRERNRKEQREYKSLDIRECLSVKITRSLTNV